MRWAPYAVAIGCLLQVEPSWAAAACTFTISAFDGEGQATGPVAGIQAAFNDVANRALLYAGSPGADPGVMKEMRRLYSQALTGVRTLGSQRHGPDYARARRAVTEFVDYVDRHPPGVLVPHDLSALN